MKSNVFAASILGTCLLIAAFVFSGRYHFLRVNECAVARGDRWTGAVKTIRIMNDEKRCSVWDEFRNAP